MKKIEFVRIKSELTGFGLGKGTKYEFDGIERTVEKRMKAGWEFCGYVPITTRGAGDIETLSLIFQKEEEVSQ